MGSRICRAPAAGASSLMAAREMPQLGRSPRRQATTQETLPCPGSRLPPRCFWHLRRAKGLVGGTASDATPQQRAIGGCASGRSPTSCTRTAPAAAISAPPVAARKATDAIVRSRRRVGQRARGYSAAQAMARNYSASDSPDGEASYLRLLGERIRETRARRGMTRRILAPIPRSPSAISPSSKAATATSRLRSCAASRRRRAWRYPTSCATSRSVRSS